MLDVVANPLDPSPASNDSRIYKRIFTSFSYLYKLLFCLVDKFTKYGKRAESPRADQFAKIGRLVLFFLLFMPGTTSCRRSLQSDNNSRKWWKKADWLLSGQNCDPLTVPIVSRSETSQKEMEDLELNFCGCDNFRCTTTDQNFYKVM